MGQVNLAAAGDKLKRIQFELGAGLLSNSEALQKASKVAENYGLKDASGANAQDALQKLLSQTQYEPAGKAAPVDLKGNGAVAKPLRGGKVAADAADEWDKDSGISKDERKKKQDHSTKASQFTDAYPFVMMAVDLAPGEGAYYDLSELSPGNPSPDAVLVGDNHLSNSGSVASSGNKPDMVYGIVDPTKAGVGRIETDLERLATTAVITAVEKGKLSRDDALQLAQAAGESYFKELQGYATTGKKPPAYLSPSELTSQNMLGDLIKKAGGKNPDAVIKKYSKDGKEFSKDFAIDDKGERKGVEKAFDDFVSRLPKSIRDSVKVLDTGTKVDVGGSNSGMPHYLVLAQVNGQKYVFEMKQQIPSPVEHKSGDPKKVDGDLAVRLADRLQPFKEPLEGYATIGDVSYLVQPYDDRDKTLDFDKASLGDLVKVSQDTATLSARVHAQTVDLGELRGWLKGVDPKAAVARLVKFAEAYSKQVELDADAMK